MLIMNSLNSDTLLLAIGALVVKYKKCNNITRNAFRRKIFAIYQLYLKTKETEKEKAQRKCWVRDILTEDQRQLHGVSNNLIKDMFERDSEKFFNYFRMTRDLYNELLALVGPKIKKQDFLRESISPEIRLQLTLRYLASGDSMASIHYTFRVGKSTVANIIAETCEVIWDSLKEMVFIKPCSENWKKIAQEFNERWNFINCVGALDGKHVVIQALPNTGSKNYNYKGTHSINLMAIADANYQFIMVDIGGEGRQSDSGVFKSSQMGEGFEKNLLDLPQSQNGLPYVLVADEAFPLTNYLMRPYPRRGKLDMRNKIFNYRLSRARRVVENTFGLLAARWRIFRKPIIASDCSVKKIIQASVCLHNYVQKHSNNMRNAHLNSDNLVSTTEGLQNLGRTGSNTFGRDAANIREAFTDYFCGDGAIEWQWQKALQNDF